jgi:hypothetical protein
MLLKFGYFERMISNIWNVLKCGAGKGWRTSVGMMVLEKYYTHSMGKGNILRKIKQTKVNFTFC